MTNAQIITLALAVVIPAAMLIYWTSRVTGAKETLRAEIQAGFAKVSADIKSVEAKLTIHELQHHYR
jgi:hypothetical protein